MKVKVKSESESGQGPGIQASSPRGTLLLRFSLSYLILMGLDISLQKGKYLVLLFFLIYMR